VTLVSGTFPDEEYQRWELTRVPRPEGYSEFRCIPAHWIPAQLKPMELYAAEGLSTLMGVHKNPDFWSASDAAMRLRRMPAKNLAERELGIYGTRRSNDYNRATPWASLRLSLAFEEQWQGQQDPHVHPFANLPNSQEDGLFGHYGMRKTILKDKNYLVTTGFGIHNSHRRKASHEPWSGGEGTWFTWLTVLGWQEIPRRQEIDQHLVQSASEGRLLLFISHRWENPTHPDPTGRQLLGIKVGLTLSLAAALVDRKDDRATSSGLPEIMRRYLQHCQPSVLQDPRLIEWAATVIHEAKETKTEAELLPKCVELEESAAIAGILKRIREDILIWYDYASMYQAPRSSAEQEEFHRELMLLNNIQSSAATVVIADDDQYMSRAWCFLEVCGGIRGSIAELTPSWSQALRLQSSFNKWANISDQLIGSLNVLGLEGIEESGLSTTEDGDLRIVARLIAALPVMGLVESDGMDLIGGSIPLPFIVGSGWVLGDQNDPPSRTSTLQTSGISEYGQLPGSDELRRVADDFAHADELQGECGMWVFTTQRALSLAWSARSRELFQQISEVYYVAKLESVCCTWADSRGLGEDGTGWTRYVPSSVRTLVIVTQVDIPDMCLVYHSVLSAHLAAGRTVITLTPENGRLMVTVPSKPRKDTVIQSDILVVPRIRRSTAYPSYLMLPQNTQYDLMEKAAALRLDPSEHAAPQLQLTAKELRNLSAERVLTEAECRTTMACWEILLEHGLNPIDWTSVVHSLEQCAILKAILKIMRSFSDSPLLRRQLFYAILEHETKQGEPLRSELPCTVSHIVESIRGQM